MSRLVLRTGQHLLDVVVLVLAFAVAFLLRFDGMLPHQMVKRLLFLLPYVVGLQFAALYLLGVPRYAWRFVGLREVATVAKAMVLGAAVFTVARVVSGALLHELGWLQYALLPYGVIVIDMVVAFLGIVGLRVTWRLWTERRDRRRRMLRAPAQSRTLLVGAGSAGVAVARELARHPDLGMIAVGFVDDDPQKRDGVVHGVPVLGTSADIGSLVAAHAIDQVVITIASASGADIRRIVQLTEAAGLPAKIIPGMHEILDGRVELSRIRPVSIEDLLGREAVELDLDLVRGFIAGRRVMVTGAGGSIGSELCRQLARLGPSSLVLLERGEPSLFTVQQELRGSFPGLDVVSTLACVCDRPRVDAILATYRPHVVFHAAAHKHVPLMEDNPGEAIKNNVIGTQQVAEASAAHGVETFVLVSTDKAVNPTSVMGASKRVAELVIQGLARTSQTRFVGVRFGNVLGSAGSVIPIFQQQIRAGGPVTVTHRDMTRYFMTIPEASQLVVQAGAMGRGGEIFVLDMGEPVRIVDLARDLIRLSGFEPETEIAIEFTGVRPGEKLFEELGFDAERMDKTRHAKIFVGRLAPVDPAALAAGLEGLRACVGAASRDEVLTALRALVPEMQEDARQLAAPAPEVSAPSREPSREPSPRMVRVPTV
ncbi:MAG: polysaccharide biosynthesis protein [Deltaproteobacteria bacterium]|nr:polysaccharide biosynthesis protein [Deltaproteobacteria bacterium]MCB9785437.1 polysaccharide biosynthesis protein [Deltaproteobacteria bacterium]